jgi:hypothetical protein
MHAATEHVCIIDALPSPLRPSSARQDLSRVWETAFGHAPRDKRNETAEALGIAGHSITKPRTQTGQSSGGIAVAVVVAVVDGRCPATPTSTFTTFRGYRGITECRPR